MSKAVRSARGELVDFDLLKIKQQIATAPKPTNVAARESFIDQKFKRRIKRLNQTATQQLQEHQESPEVVDEEEPHENEE